MGSLDSLPGMNECPPRLSSALEIESQPLAKRKVILIATSTIHNETFFVNGLYQNICILYKVFEALGYAPILLVNEKPKDLNKVPTILRSTRMITVEDVLQTPMPIFLYLEIGMSIDPKLRAIFRGGGARVAKLYLGNILNIDTETPMFYSGMNFSHHIVGEIDQIWVSPHYMQHMEYAAVLNHVEPLPETMKIAPYVWDPYILTLDGERNFKWRPRTSEPETIVILEPNISFQKAALIPILIAEQSYRRNKRPLEVLVGNGERLMKNPFFTKTILPTLELAKDGKIRFSGRHDIPSIMRDYPHAIAICHQWNNQYNYMALEYMFAGFPVIHNAPDWEDAGYFYKGHSVEGGLEALRRAQTTHAGRGEQYKSGAEAVRWRHSIYNPDIQTAWRRLLV